MLARKFRVLFHNVEQGVFCTGSLYDEENEEGFTYLYIGGSSDDETEPPFEDEYYRKLGIIDFLVLADFSLPQIKKLIKVLKYSIIRVIVYPYTVPVQRMLVLQEAIASGEADTQMLSFIRDPYRYLKRKQIMFVYPLLGNGPIYTGQETGNRHDFAMAAPELVDCVTDLEGYKQPVVEAGYILENRWLMFLGSYGMDLMSIREFCDRQQALEEGRSDYNPEDTLQLERRLTAAYLAEFGRDSFGTVVMYSAPVNDGPSVDDSLLMVKTMNNLKHCKPSLTPDSEMCSAYCMYKDDHDECKRHNQVSMANHIHGVMLLGDLDLKKNYKNLINRFSVIANSIRFITIPKNREIDCWDKKILNWGVKGHRKYWISTPSIHPQIVKDIIEADPSARYMNSNRNCGICIYGFLAPITQERYDNKARYRQF